MVFVYLRKISKYDYLFSFCIGTKTKPQAFLRKAFCELKHLFSPHMSRPDLNLSHNF